MSAHVHAALDRLDHRLASGRRVRTEPTAAELVERCRSLRARRVERDPSWREQGYSDRDAWELLEFDPFAAHNDER